MPGRGCGRTLIECVCNSKKRLLVAEKEPTPISRGIEIQKVRIEEFQNLALEQYKKVTRLSTSLEERIDAALSDVPNPEGLSALTTLFEKKHALEEIGRELEDLILRGFDHQDELQRRWERIESRFLDLATDDDFRNM